MYLQWVKSPSIPVPDQTKNGTNVVTEDDLHEESAVDEPCAVKYFIVLSQFLRLVLGRRVLISSTLVDIENFSGNILNIKFSREVNGENKIVTHIMVSTQKNQKSTCRRGHQKQPAIRKDIGP